VTEIQAHCATKRLPVADVAKLARAIYASIGGGIKYKQIFRPYICPFHILIDCI
jgi:hypothetical protein